MKFAKYLLIPWFTLGLYTVLSVYNGATGIISYKELQIERDKILENLTQLQVINEELRGNVDALRFDPETIKVRARELGYGERGEQFVRIVGLPGGRPRELRPGMIRTAVIHHPNTNPNWAVHRTISFCAGLLLLSLFLVVDLLIKPESP